jgi:hypothetical protein
MRVPTADDTEGLAVAYGASGAHAGCGGASVAGGRTGGGVDAWAAAALLGVAGAWLTRRRGVRRAVPVCAAAVALLAGSGDARSAAATGLAPAADAHAVVLSAETSRVAGVLQTRLVLAPTACRTADCPDRLEVSVWGGTLGSITQVVGEHPAPRAGEEVDVAFARAAQGGGQAFLVAGRTP